MTVYTLFTDVSQSRPSAHYLMTVGWFDNRMPELYRMVEFEDRWRYGGLPHTAFTFYSRPWFRSQFIRVPTFHPMTYSGVPFVCRWSSGCLIRQVGTPDWSRVFFT